VQTIYLISKSSYRKARPADTCLPCSARKSFSHNAPRQDLVGVAFSLFGSCPVLLMFGNFRIEMIPRLGATHPNIGLGLEPTWVLKAGSSHPQEFRFGRTRGKQGRSALPAERAFSDIAACSGLVKERWLPLEYSHGAARHDQSRRIGTATSNLTITAMTVEHSHWRYHALVTNRPTRTSAPEWNFHFARHGTA